MWTKNTLSLNSWVGEACINIRLENGYIPEEDKHYGEDRRFEQDAVTFQNIKKNQKYKNIQRKSSINQKPKKAA